MLFNMLNLSGQNADIFNQMDWNNWRSVLGRYRVFKKQGIT